MFKLLIPTKLMKTLKIFMKKMGDEKMDLNTGINNDIKFLAKSEIRLKILNELHKEPNNVRGIVKETKITYSSVSSNIGKLEKNNHIEKINNKYHINPMTEVYLKSLMDFKNSLDMINNYEEFWAKHNVNQLSIDSVKNITDLKNCKLIEATPIEIFKTHNTLKRQIMNAKDVKAIFPYLHPEYPRLIENVLKNDGSVELIIPQNIFKELVFRIDRNIRRESIKKRRLKVYNFKNNLNIYLTICDKNMGLGLFKNDGSFDQNRILVSENNKSHRWAEKLFTHVKNQVI